MSFFRWLWQQARVWPDPGMGLRPGGGAAVFVTFLTLLFMIIGAVLVAAGFDLNDVERWLDAQGGWLDAVGTVIFKALLVFVLLICAFTVLGALFDRRNPDRPGIVQALFALIVAWFAWSGLFI